jgi:hypothetical protein
MGTSEVGNGVPCMALHELGVGRDVGHVHPKGWGWLFWLVQLRSGGQMDLRADVKRRHAGALVLVLVVCRLTEMGAALLVLLLSKVSGHLL